MIRYDQVKKDNVSKENIGKEKEKKKELKHVKLTHEDIQKISNSFLKKLDELVIDEIKILDSYTDEIIILNDYSLEKLKELTKDNSLKSKLDFIKNYYMHGFDHFVTDAMGDNVIAIQEPPYSFMGTENENIIQYEFLK